MKNSFVMYADWLDMIAELDDTARSELLMAIMLYQNGKELPDMSIGARVAFAQMKNQFDKDSEKYEEVCEKRREAGSLGGQANASKRKQMVANGSKCKQMGSKSSKRVANQADNDNENDNENDSKERRKEEVYYPNDERLNLAFCDYVDMRKKIKSPMTDRAITLAQNKLKELASIPFSDMMDIDLAIKILNQSTMNNWKGLFPLKEEKKKSEKFNNFDNNSFGDIDELERKLIGG